MTEEQAAEMIELLKAISESVSNIESSMPSTTYDLGDVCSNLNDVKRAIEKLER